MALKNFAAITVLCIAAVLVLSGCASNTAQGAQGGAQGLPSNGTGGSGQGTVQPATHEVIISNFAFSPSELTIKTGDTVAWTNNDSATHTITSDSGGELSGNVPQGQAYSHTFNSAGTYAYHCSIHTSMKGTITVEG